MMYGTRDDLTMSRFVLARGKVIVLFLWILGEAGSTWAQSPNILENSGFDIDLSAWTSEGTVVWSTVDVDNDPTSGSALFDSTSAVYLRQCVEVEANLGYLETVMIRYAGEPAQDDESRLRIFWYSGDLCDVGTNVGSFDRTFIPQDMEWHQLRLLRLLAPPSAASAKVDVVAIPTSGAGLVHLDNFQLIPHGIFSDGFESGDTSAWQGSGP